MFNFFKKKETNYTIYAVVDGTTVPLKEVNDPTFAQEMIGKGVAIRPENGKIVSPVNGTVSMVFPTGHAVGLVSEDGVEVLIHIGIDTVNLQGVGFTSHVSQNDTVKVGDVLVDVDLDALKDAGYDTVIPVIITNTPSYSEVNGLSGKSVKAGEEIISIKK